MLCGFLPVVKPKGPSSAAIVGKVRRLTKIKKIGHSGTLDPAAEGLLLLAFQRATSLIQYLPSDKKYRATIQLGKTTDTLDGEGNVLTEQSVDPFSEERIHSVVQSYQGAIEQIPPMVSALQVKGQRLYKLARNGITVERSPRPITIHHINVLSYDHPNITINVHCSSGTYIRTLADDIGRDLGCGAYLEHLERTACGLLDLDQAIKLEELQMLVEQRIWTNKLVAPLVALRQMPTYSIADKDSVNAIRHGRSLAKDDMVGSPDEGPFLIVDGSKTLLAVGQQIEDVVKMERVLLPASEVKL